MCTKNELMKVEKYTNELIHESSPYLLEHAHNPVNWFAWGDKALEKAKKENKPLIISIGYAACHWCHVMEHESYSSEEVAQFMNEHFVAIKVDREERMDIDLVYMNAAMLINGRGGWPLNAFAMPDGRPFFADTYFKKDQWLELMDKVVQLYKGSHEELNNEANNLSAGIGTCEIEFASDDASEMDKNRIYHESFNRIIGNVDFAEGGFGGAPKFPMPVGLDFLLQYNYLNKNEYALKAVTLSLNKMAMGGIYDQLGGGFARYATDDLWKIPHFEKMLYDNAQLVSLYAHAYRATKNEIYADVITETLEFIKREMTNQEGGFYSSLNADSEGVEGKFYVWNTEEINEILGVDDAKLLSDYYNVTLNGNWESGINILHKKMYDSEFALKHNLSIDTLKAKLLSAKKTVLKARNRRVRPSTDDKILTSWNALMLTAYLNGYKALNKPEYIESALKSAKFLEKNMVLPNGGLMRNFKNGQASITAFLDDYALLIEAFIELYQVTFDIYWLNVAKTLASTTIEQFKDSESALFFFTSNQSETIVARKMEISDNVIPSSNSIMAKNLFKLGTFYYNTHYLQLSENMINSVINEIANGAVYYANWASLLGLMVSTKSEVTIMGSNALALNRELQNNYLPTSLFMGGMEENLPLLESQLVANDTLIYVCKNKMCALPASDIHTAIDLIIR